ncbi:MAG: restriction endonuclease subunit S [Coprococcus eutactus]|nr:restriction endonuclease subunit S [Coprococcus eutactus]
MREMRDSGVEWIGEIPKDWHITQTRRLFRNEKNIVGDAADEYERLALTLKGVIKRSKNDSEGLQPEKFEGYQILRQNELVFKMIDLENVNTSRVGLSPYTGLVSPAYIVLKNDSDDNRYEYYWFMSMYYNEVFNHLGGDGVRSALNVKDMLSLPIPNISKIQKKTLADYLDVKCSKIDEIIEKQQAIIEKLKEYKLSYINEVTNVNDGIKCHLGFIGQMKNGFNFTDTSEGHKIKFLGVGDFKDNFFVDKEEMFSTIISEENVAEDYMLHSGDIVFVRSNGSKELVGRAIMVNGIEYPVTYSGFCIRFRNIRPDIIDSKFLLYYFRSLNFRKQLEKYSQGSNISNLNQDLLSSLQFTIPSKDYQKRMLDEMEIKCKEIDTAVIKFEGMNNKLQEYKKSLIYEVVTGKKEV